MNNCGVKYGAVYTISPVCRAECAPRARKGRPNAGGGSERQLALYSQRVEAFLPWAADVCDVIGPWCDVILEIKSWVETEVWGEDGDINLNTSTAHLSVLDVSASSVLVFRGLAREMDQFLRNSFCSCRHVAESCLATLNLCLYSLAPHRLYSRHVTSAYAMAEAPE